MVFFNIKKKILQKRLAIAERKAERDRKKQARVSDLAIRKAILEKKKFDITRAREKKLEQTQKLVRSIKGEKLSASKKRQMMIKKRKIEALKKLAIKKGIPAAKATARFLFTQPKKRKKRVVKRKVKRKVKSKVKRKVKRKK